LTNTTLDIIYASVPYMPFTIRLLAREALLAMRIKFPDAMDEELTPSVAKTVVLPFILSAIM
jgi:Ras GTPase-activating-like protein IQGAP2/3